jgi:hypothetical protein
VIHTSPPATLSRTNSLSRNNSLTGSRKAGPSRPINAGIRTYIPQTSALSSPPGDYRYAPPSPSVYSENGLDFPESPSASLKSPLVRNLSSSEYNWRSPKYETLTDLPETPLSMVTLPSPLHIASKFMTGVAEKKSTPNIQSPRDSKNEKRRPMSPWEEKMAPQEAEQSLYRVKSNESRGSRKQSFDSRRPSTSHKKSLDSRRPDLSRKPSQETMERMQPTKQNQQQKQQLLQPQPLRSNGFQETRRPAPYPSQGTLKRFSLIASESFEEFPRRPRSKLSKFGSFILVVLSLGAYSHKELKAQPKRKHHSVPKKGTSVRIAEGSRRGSPEMRQNKAAKKSTETPDLSSSTLVAKVTTDFSSLRGDSKSADVFRQMGLEPLSESENEGVLREDDRIKLSKEMRRRETTMTIFEEAMGQKRQGAARGGMPGAGGNPSDLPPVPELPPTHLQNQLPRPRPHSPINRPPSRSRSSPKPQALANSIPPRSRSSPQPQVSPNHLKKSHTPYESIGEMIISPPIPVRKENSDTGLKAQYRQMDQDYSGPTKRPSTAPSDERVKESNPNVYHGVPVLKAPNPPQKKLPQAPREISIRPPGAGPLSSQPIQPQQQSQSSIDQQTRAKQMNHIRSFTDLNRTSSLRQSQNNRANAMHSRNPSSGTKSTTSTPRHPSNAPSISTMPITLRETSSASTLNSHFRSRSGASGQPYQGIWGLESAINTPNMTVNNYAGRRSEDSLRPRTSGRGRSGPGYEEKRLMVQEGLWPPQMNGYRVRDSSVANVI